MVPRFRPNLAQASKWHLVVTVPLPGRALWRLEMYCQKVAVPEMDGWLTCWCFQMSYTDPSQVTVPTLVPWAEPAPLLVYSWT